MILNDREIEKAGIINPFLEGQKRPGKISYGVSHFGYDIRIARKFKLFTTGNGPVVDPKNINDSCFVDIEADKCIIPPNSYALGESVEYFKMPEDVIGLCVGKSSYARCGIIVNVTPAEPGWEGILTIEIGNGTPRPVVVYAEEGIAQMLFFRGNEPSTNYNTKGGKYQNQDGLTLPRVD